MKTLFTYLKFIFSASVVLVLLWAFVVDVTQLMPDNADVMVDDNSKVYYSPMYFFDSKIGDWEHLRLTKASEAKSKGYTPDPDCRKAGFFTYEKGAQFWDWLDSAGIIKQKKRWNPDGTWNW